MTASSVSGPNMCIKSSMSWQFDSSLGLLLLGKYPLCLRASVRFSGDEWTWANLRSRKFTKVLLRCAKGLGMILGNLRVDFLTWQRKWHRNISRCHNMIIILIRIDEFVRNCIVRRLVVVVGIVSWILEVHADVAAAVIVDRFCTGNAVGVYSSRGLELRRREWTSVALSVNYLYISLSHGLRSWEVGTSCDNAAAAAGSRARHMQSVAQRDQFCAEALQPLLQHKALIGRRSIWNSFELTLDCSHTSR